MLPCPLESSSARIFIAALLLLITRLLSLLDSNEIHFAPFGKDQGNGRPIQSARDAVAENVVVESEPQNILAVIEPVKIEVVHRQTAVLILVHEDEG